MAVTTHIPTKLMNAQGAETAGQMVKFSDGTPNIFKCLWIKAGSGLPNMSSSGIQFVQDVITSNGEDTAISSSGRLSLSGISWANDATLGQVDWTFSNVVYPQNAGDDGLSRYWVIYYTGVGSGDTTYPIVAIVDPGATVSVVGGSLTIQAPTGGLIEFTGGG